jgi:hypothetical protein
MLCSLAKVNRRLSGKHLHLQSSAYCLLNPGFLLRDLKDGGQIFLRNVCCPPHYRRYIPDELFIAIALWTSNSKRNKVSILQESALLFLWFLSDIFQKFILLLMILAGTAKYHEKCRRKIIVNTNIVFSKRKWDIWTVASCKLILFITSVQRMQWRPKWNKKLWSRGRIRIRLENDQLKIGSETLD